MNEIYVHGYTPHESRRLQDQASTLIDLLHRDTFYPPGSRVLEAGCGVGAQTLTLAHNSPDAQITSIDVSAGSLVEARKRAETVSVTNVQFRQADIFALPFAGESFDHVFVCFVLEHLSHPVQALAALRAVLKPSGTITVIEGDHGSAYFYPHSEAAHKAIQCQVQLQSEAGGNALSRAPALTPTGPGRFQGGQGFTTDGVCGFDKAGPGGWRHQENIHGDDWGRSRSRD